MAILNLEYYTQKDLYSDGDIEEQMLKMAKEGVTCEELSSEQVSFPVIYHFSDLRANILNWYPIKKSDSVLEIGAGCGAITGTLCEKAGQVTSVELSKRRAQINYYRNEKKDNLTIMVGNLNDMDLGQQYDYVVVNGVLEYAMSFTEGDTPYETFLGKMGSYLKNTGKLLIAIENKLGMKYFAGAPEDHTDIPFFGINGYPENHSVRTFSKTELQELVKKSGFPFQKFYYPYPDYKFPTEIFTDASLTTNHYGKNYPIYTDKTVDLFSESAGIEAMKKEQIADRFVNSFLLVAGKQELEEKEEILYVKLNQGRRKEFRTLTQLVRKEESVWAEKKPLCPEAENFIAGLKKTGAQKPGKGFRNLPCRYENGGIVYPVLSGKTLEDRIRDLVEKEQTDEILRTLKHVYEHVFAQRKKEPEYQTKVFKEVFGEHPGKEYYECVSPANIDLICANIFEFGDDYEIIDYEWTFDFPVPVAFIMWRMIHELYYRIPKLGALYTQDDMNHEFGIEPSDSEIFLAWTMHFTYEYVGSDSLDVYRKERIPVDLSETVRACQEKKRFRSKLYYDTGSGLSEENSIKTAVELDRGRFQVTFDLQKVENICGIRWNLLSETFCEVKVEVLDCGCHGELIPFGMRIDKAADAVVFLNLAGGYFIHVTDPSELKKITISGQIRFLSQKEIAEEIQLEEDRKEAVRREEERKLQQRVQKEERIAAKKAEEERRQEELRAAMEFQHRPKQRTKRLVKKMLGRPVAPLVTENQQTEQPVSSCVGSIDSFSYENNVLQIIGWAFDRAYAMENTHLAFLQNGEVVAEEPITVVYRSDVAAVLQIPEAESCGFSCVLVVHSPVETEVAVVYDTVDGEKAYPLCKIPADPGCNEIQVYTLEGQESIGNIRYFKERYLEETPVFDAKIPSDEVIDIIIPIYNGLQYFDKLFAGIEKTKMKYRLILVDDQSPDPAVREYLERYVAEHEGTVLLRNEKNMGFLPSVNRALAIAEHHVALVNTDVEVPEGWLERLMWPIFTKEKVASSTPFTTCGTICSFPNFCEDNVIFEGMPLWQIDDAFRQIRPQYATMPTGIGFCMGMNLEAIREVGLLDEENFDKGYGEENDWCQRAIQAGYTNVQVENLFVYHKHGGSFSSEEKLRLLKSHLERLAKKHPNYNSDTAAFCRRDPARTIRLYVETQLLNQLLDVPTIVAFDHNLGGGATEYLIEKRKLALKEGKRFLTVRFDIDNMRYYLEYEYKKYKVQYFAKDLEMILDEIPRVDEIWINELVTYQKIYQVLDQILELKEKHQAHLKMLLHDFFFMCPAVNLMDAQGKYCHGADAQICNQCIPANRSNACLDYESGTAWRTHWREFLSRCDEILAFSDDTAQIFKKTYPYLYQLHVLPHKPHYVTALDKKVKTTRTLNIGLLGVLCYKKGLDVVKEMIKEIEMQNLNIRMKLIGVSDEEIDSPVFSCTGRYTRDELPRLTMEEDIDLFFIPSIWPETFSYTTSEIMSMHMPVAVFPIGAPVERVKHYEKGLVLKGTDAKAALKELQEFAEQTLKCQNMSVCEKKILFVGEEISFASRYRVEHFREQLHYQGYGSDFYQVDEVEDLDWDAYRAVVCYRCSREDVVCKVVEQAKKIGLNVYYDIDDLIFDYERISYLHFLTGSEYKDFKKTTEQIHSCMELCDGYFTSTDTLAGEIRREFPGKPVVINRNCASMEMQILSHDAVEQVEKDPEHIFIGYFSGSKTHDQDFEVAEEALLEVMKEHPEVRLKLVGVLSDRKMEKFGNKVEKLPFMDWKQLPSVMAGIDINLMPLEDSIFHCSKSENKWMEAALVKVPSVMSRNREMEGVIENGVDGWLCSDKEEWKKALTTLIEEKTARVQMGEKAHKKVMCQYVTQNTGKDAREELLCSEKYS